MLVAIPQWRGRVSPVFDAAAQIVLVELAEGREVGRRLDTLPVGPPAMRAGRLAELGVGVLVCGAISRPLEWMLRAQSIEVIPCICGEVEEVIQALCDGSLDQERFVMPGCSGRRRRYCRRRRRRGKDADI